MNRKTLLKGIIFALALTAIAVNFLIHRSTAVPSPATQQAAKQFAGVDPNDCFEDTNGEILGDPSRTEAQLRGVYQKALIFKRRHGRLPNNDLKPMLWDDMELNPAAYKFSSREQARKFGQNPDSRYAAEWQKVAGAEKVNPYFMPGIRPDGSVVGGPKSPDTRDILAFTRTYVFRGGCLKTGKIGQPMGFYLILWEDGQVQRFALDEVRHARPQRGPFDECFPGQAGLPDKRYTWDEAVRLTKPLNRDGTNPNVSAAELKRTRSGK